jgi:hypothetical protein
LNWAENYQSVIEFYQTTDHPALSPKSGGSPCRIYLVDSAPPREKPARKTRQKNPPIDWKVGEGERYAFGLAWLIFTTAIVF